MAGDGGLVWVHHGEFPYLPDTGYGTTAPVGPSAANAYGLSDMVGTVWEWTTDRWADDGVTESCCAAESCDPTEPQFTYCLRHRPAARQLQMVDTGMSHVGFRCVRAG